MQIVTGKTQIIIHFPEEELYNQSREDLNYQRGYIDGYATSSSGKVVACVVLRSGSIITIEPKFLQALI